VLAWVAIAATVISLALFALRPSATWPVVVLATGFGAVTYPMYALVVAHANDYAGPGDFVRVSSSLLLLYGIGTMIGPVLAAIAMDRLAPEGLFAFTALVDAGIIGYTLYRMRQRPAQAHREPFKAIPPPRSVTPESAVLDPRAGDEPTPVDPSPAVEA
jgi:MFS family permease